MNFSENQKALLAKPLTAGNVKSRDQAGRKVSYVEGWHVIAEANRIFGFDGWARQTLKFECVSARERSIGRTNPQPGWGVTYIAQVRIAVGDVIREGCGAGHGIDKDLGQAHESALKEAETDAMKRAFMTFGNQFGLALYDKEQAGVADEPSAKDALIERSRKTIAEFGDAQKLGEWWNSDSEKAARRFVGMDSSEVNTLKELVMDRREKLMKNGAAPQERVPGSAKTPIDIDNEVPF